MPTFEMSPPPGADGGRIDEQKLRSWLCRLVDELKYTLNNLDGENVTTLQASRLQGFGEDVAKIAKLVVGRTEIGTAQVQHLDAMVAKIATAVIDSAHIDWTHIVNADIDFADVKVGSTEHAFNAEMVGDKVLIKNLSVDDATIVSLTVGNLVIKDPETGVLYKVYAQANEETGETELVREQVRVSTGDIADNAVNGDKIVAGSVTASKLNVAEIMANEATIAEVTANAALINALTANKTFTSYIAGIGDTLNISGNQAITLQAGRIDDILDESDSGSLASGVKQYRTVVRVDESGAHFRSGIDGAKAEVVVSGDGLTLADADGVVTTRIQAGETIAPKIVAEETLGMGHYAFQVLGSGAVGLMYVGGN